MNATVTIAGKGRCKCERAKAFYRSSRRSRTNVTAVRNGANYFEGNNPRNTRAYGISIFNLRDANSRLPARSFSSVGIRRLPKRRLYSTIMSP